MHESTEDTKTFPGEVENKEAILQAKEFQYSLDILRLKFRVKFARSSLHNAFLRKALRRRL